MLKILIQAADYVEPVAYLAALAILFRSGQLRVYTALGAYLFLNSAVSTSCVVLIHLLRGDVNSSSLAYTTYFWTYWACTGVQSFISLYIVLGVFRLALAPLEGLRNLGMFVFRWAMALSVVLAFVLGFHPTGSASGTVPHLIHQFSQISNVFILGLLLFVCFAIRPMGLTHRSRQFGVSLGLGVAACSQLLQTALEPTSDLYDMYNVCFTYVQFLAVVIWAVYFYLPEIKPRIMVLPTTSPYLLWNEISEALGDAPGYVAIGRVSPDIFAVAEMEFMVRASAAINEAEKTKALQSAEPRALSA